MVRGYWGGVSRFRFPFTPKGAWKRKRETLERRSGIDGIAVVASADDVVLAETIEGLAECGGAHSAGVSSDLSKRLELSRCAAAGA